MGRRSAKRIDFARRANHLTAVLAKAVMQTLYRQPPKYAYFMGCSDGGREALMEAQRFPQDFDGISAGAPAAFFQFQNSFFHGWNVAANQRPDGTAILLKNRLPLIHRAVLAHCPTLSGVQDGVLQNPYACQFSESWLPCCPADARDRSTCLTQEEIEVVKSSTAALTTATAPSSSRAVCRWVPSYAGRCPRRRPATQCRK